MNEFPRNKNFNVGGNKVTGLSNELPKIIISIDSDNHEIGWLNELPKTMDFKDFGNLLIGWLNELCLSKIISSILFGKLSMDKLKPAPNLIFFINPGNQKIDWLKAFPNESEIRLADK